MDVCCFAAFIAPPPSWLMGAFLQMSSLEVFKGQKIPVIDTPAAFDNNLFVPSICYHIPRTLQGQPVFLGTTLMVLLLRYNY